MQAQLAHIRSVDADGARFHIAEARHQTRQRRLPRAALSHQRDHFPAPDLERNVAQLRPAGAGIAEAYVVECDAIGKPVEFVAPARSSISSGSSRYWKTFSDAPIAC